MTRKQPASKSVKIPGLGTWQLVEASPGGSDCSYERFLRGAWQLEFDVYHGEAIVNLKRLRGDEVEIQIRRTTLRRAIDGLRKAIREIPR